MTAVDYTKLNAERFFKLVEMFTEYLKKYIKDNIQIRTIRTIMYYLLTISQGYGHFSGISFETHSRLF